MEDSKLNPEDNNSLEYSSETNKDSNKDENVKAFSEFLEKASNQENADEKENSDLKVEKVITKNNFIKK